MEPHGTFVLPNMHFDLGLLRPMALCLLSGLICLGSRQDRD